VTEQEFRVVYPLIAGWIQQTLAEHAMASLPVTTPGFSRLPQITTSRTFWLPRGSFLGRGWPAE
jgi:hypothetical protein